MDLKLILVILRSHLCASMQPLVNTMLFVHGGLYYNKLLKSKPREGAMSIAAPGIFLG